MSIRDHLRAERCAANVEAMRRARDAWTTNPGWGFGWRTWGTAPPPPWREGWSRRLELNRLAGVAK